jgi:hypothetical protein
MGALHDAMQCPRRRVADNRKKHFFLKKEAKTFANCSMFGCGLCTPKLRRGGEHYGG